MRGMVECVIGYHGMLFFKTLHLHNRRLNLHLIFFYEVHNIVHTTSGTISIHIVLRVPLHVTTHPYGMSRFKKLFKGT